jgi:hypothetical protein
MESSQTENRIVSRQSPVSRQSSEPLQSSVEAIKSIMPAATAATILGMSRPRFFTILLIVLAGGFLIFKLRPYIAYVSSLVDLLRTLFNSTIGLAADTSTGIIDNAATGTDVIVKKISGTSRKQIRLPEPIDSKTDASEWTADKTEKVENDPKPKSKKEQKSPEPDDTTSSVQSKSGYCHVGDWKGVRSCVKVNGGCKGKVYDTEEDCTSK